MERKKKEIKTADKTILKSLEFHFSALKIKFFPPFFHRFIASLIHEVHIDFYIAS